MWIEKVNVNARELHTLYQELWTDIEFLTHRSAFYHNKHHAEVSILKKKDKIYLLQKNINITRSSRKLNYIKIKSFKIVKSIKRVSFKLDLSKKMKKKHLIFYVSLLKLVLLEILVQCQVSDNYFIN